MKYIKKSKGKSLINLIKMKNDDKKQKKKKKVKMVIFQGKNDKITITPMRQKKLIKHL